MDPFFLSAWIFSVNPNSSAFSLVKPIPSFKIPVVEITASRAASEARWNGAAKPFIGPPKDFKVLLILVNLCTVVLSAISLEICFTNASSDLRDLLNLI